MTQSNGQERKQWQQLAHSALTARQWDVVRLLPTGVGNPEIAKELYVSRPTVSAHLQQAYGKLERFAHNANVTRLSRAGLTVVCVRSGQADEHLMPAGWALGLLHSLSALERDILLELTRGAPAGPHVQLTPALAFISKKLQPYSLAAGITQLDRAGMAEMFVRSYTVRTPETLRLWQESARRQVSDHTQSILGFVVQGYTTPAICELLGMPKTAIETRLKRASVKLEPYASAVGAVRPRSRTALATVAALAQLDKM